MFPTHHRRFIFKMFTFVASGSPSTPGKGGGAAPEVMTPLKELVSADVLCYKSQCVCASSNSSLVSHQVYIHCDTAVCQPSHTHKCEPQCFRKRKLQYSADCHKQHHNVLYRFCFSSFWLKLMREICNMVILLQLCHFLVTDNQDHKCVFVTTGLTGSDNISFLLQGEISMRRTVKPDLRPPWSAVQRSSCMTQWLNSIIHMEWSGNLCSRYLLKHDWLWNKYTRLWSQRMSIALFTLGPPRSCGEADPLLTLLMEPFYSVQHTGYYILVFIWRFCFRTVQLFYYCYLIYTCFVQ